MEVQAFFDGNRTFTLSYVIYDPETRDAVIIDPVLDLDTTPWRTFTETADSISHFVKEHELNVHWVLDSHVHADHLSGANEIKQRLGAKLAIGDHITVVQETFKAAFNLPDSFPTDGSQFDHLLKDGETLEAGSLHIEVMHTPGHTPACCTYKIGNALFTGDVMFMPDVGVARCDFPKGSARDLYQSITQKLYSQADDTLVYTGHDYPKGRDMQYCTTIGECKASNVDLPDKLDEETFVSKITERDSKLPAPRLLFPSLQVNIRAGQLPNVENNEISYLKIPLNFL